MVVLSVWAQKQKEHLCLYFSKRHFSWARCQWGRSLFSHLSLTAVVNRLQTSLLQGLTAAAFCLLRDELDCWGWALISAPSFQYPVKLYSAIYWYIVSYPDRSERSLFFFLLKIMSIKYSLHSSAEFAYGANLLITTLHFHIGEWHVSKSLTV